MEKKNHLKAISWVCCASLCMSATFVAAGTQQTPIDPTLQRYLDCVNSAAKAQQAEGSDKLSNAQSVIGSCADQKQALLQALPGKATLRIIGKLEGHLKKREKQR